MSDTTTITVRATWVSSGVDADGNIVPKVKYVEAEYPEFLHWVHTVLEVPLSLIDDRVTKLAAFPCIGVAREADPSIDPVDTSHVIDHVFDSFIPNVDSFVDDLVAELERRRDESKKRGLDLTVTVIR